MKEIWKPVRGFEEYAEISNLGQIHYYAGKSKKYPDERWTYGWENDGGYLNATIGNVSKGVHVWVYETFYNCDIPKGLEVNHIDENKHNNCVWNLNLLTSKENKNWGTGIARMAAAKRGKPNPKVAAALTNHPKRSKAVQALDKNGNVVYEFPSTKEAGRQGFDASTISQCCLGKRKTHKGFIWCFAV